MAEVRDATPLTNAAGEVIGFPTVERLLLTACIDGLRRARAQWAARGWTTTGSSCTRGRRSSCRCPSWRPLPVGRAADGRRRLDEIVLLGRMQGARGAPRDVALRFSNTPGTGVGLR